MPSDAALKSKARAGLSGAQISALSMLLVAVVAGVVYARALALGFYNDDPTGHFAWMEGVSFLGLFTSSAGYGFYRPLTFAIWKALLAVIGHYDGCWFHAVPVALHCANTALLWLLAFRLTGKRAYAWATSLFFALFPLSYEAVAYVAAMFHPLVTFWILLTLVLYERARRTQAKACLIGAHVTMLLGLFTHENGVIIPFLLLAWELAQPPVKWRSLVRRPVRWFFVAPVLFAVLWQLIPKTSGQGLQSPAAALHNVPPFLEVYVYPLLPLLHIHAQNALLFASLAGGTAALMYAIAHYSGLRRTSLFAALWFIGASLPAILFLSPAYVSGSPRLYYLPSVGAALLWGVPVQALAGLARGSSLRRYGARALALVLSAAVLVPPLSFIRCELDFQSLATQVVRGMADRAAAAPASRGVVLVNVPFFFSSGPCYPSGCKTFYPYAPTGAVVIPPYASAADFSRVNGGPARDVRAVTFTGYNPGWSTHGEAIDDVGLRASVADDQVYVFDLVNWSWFDLSSAWQLDAPPASRLQATFGDVSLDDTTVERKGEGFSVSLRWQVIDPPSQPLTVFVHVYDSSGTLVAQHDGPPAQGYAPFPLWQANDVILDVHDVQPELPLAPGTYTLAVGLYNPNTGERLAASSPGQGALADNEYVIEQLMIGGED